MASDGFGWLRVASDGFGLPLIASDFRMLIAGACLYGFFVASLTTAISEADASAKDYRTKLDMVNQYMRHSQLPKPLRLKLRTYFELCFPSKRSFDEVRISPPPPRD